MSILLDQNLNEETSRQLLEEHPIGTKSDLVIGNLLTLTMPNFLNGTPSIFGTVHYHFRDIKMNTLSWSANSIVWSDCTDVQAGLALYYWHRLLTFGVGKIRVIINYRLVLKFVMRK